MAALRSFVLAHCRSTVWSADVPVEVVLSEEKAGWKVIAVCVLIVAGIFLGDLWIKTQIEKRMTEGETKCLCRGRILLRRHHNRGVMLNFLQKRQPVVAVLSLVLTAAVAVLFGLSLGTRGNNLLRVGLSLLLGGAFSNTYDRLKRKFVVDYLSFGVKWNRLSRIIFNISDFCIITGALLTVIGISD